MRRWNLHFRRVLRCLVARDASITIGCSTIGNTRGWYKLSIKRGTGQIFYIPLHLTGKNEKYDTFDPLQTDVKTNHLLLLASLQLFSKKLYFRLQILILSFFWSRTVVNSIFWPATVHVPSLTIYFGFFVCFMNVIIPHCTADPSVTRVTRAAMTTQVRQLSSLYCSEKCW